MTNHMTSHCTKQDKEHKKTLSYTHLVDVGDKLALRRVPRLLFAGSQLHLNVKKLHLQVAAFSVPEGGRWETAGREGESSIFTGEKQERSVSSSLLGRFLDGAVGLEICHKLLHER